MRYPHGRGDNCGDLFARASQPPGGYELSKSSDQAWLVRWSGASRPPGESRRVMRAAAAGLGRSLCLACREESTSASPENSRDPWVNLTSLWPWDLIKRRLVPCFHGEDTCTLRLGIQLYQSPSIQVRGRGHIIRSRIVADFERLLFDLDRFIENVGCRRYKEVLHGVFFSPGLSISKVSIRSFPILSGRFPTTRRGAVAGRAGPARRSATATRTLVVCASRSIYFALRFPPSTITPLSTLVAPGTRHQWQPAVWDAIERRAPRAHHRATLGSQRASCPQTIHQDLRVYPLARRSWRLHWQYPPDR